jgi:hypothetical protein
MISSMTRNQDDIESKTTTLSKIEQVSETTTSSKTQNAQIIKTSSECDSFSIENLNVNVQSNEYERLLTTKRKIEQTRKIQLLREQKNQEWSAIFTLSLHSKNTKKTQFESISINVRNVIMRQKRYLKIIKSNIYKSNNSQKLNIFIKVCQIIFDVRFVIYKNDVHRINFVKSLLSNNVSDFDWAWQKYRLRLDETAKFVFIWKQFCDFLRKQVNSIKFRITFVEQKIKLLHQRNNQSIAQLITYLEVLKKQWLELISNSLRASNFLLVLHEYLRKKIIRKNVNVANRKIVEEIARQMKTMKTNSHLKILKSDHKQSKKQFANNKRFKNDHQNEIQLMTIVIADSNQKKIRSTKNLSHIICYTCDKSRHYKSQCRNDDIDKQSRKNRNRST